MVKKRHLRKTPTVPRGPVAPVGWNPQRATDEVEVIQLARNIRVGIAERMEFHIFALYTVGQCRHEVDFESHTCGVGTLVHVRPGQVHRFGLAAQGTFDGLGLLVSPTFVPTRRNARADVWHDGFFDDVAWPPCLTLARRDHAAVVTSFKEIQRLATTSASRLTSAILRHRVAATVLDMARRAGLGVAPATAVDDIDRARAFRAAIERSFRVTRNVGDYAERLGCSPRTLDRTARAALGVSAKEAIDARVVLEAKRLLLHTPDAIAAIGEDLGFSEPTNFAKFFKVRVGELAGAFRQRHASATGEFDGGRGA